MSNSMLSQLVIMAGAAYVANVFELTVSSVACGLLVLLAVHWMWSPRELQVTREYVITHRADTPVWLNTAIRHWWRFSSASFDDVIKRNVNSLLEGVRVGWFASIDLHRFTAGEGAPTIMSMKAFDENGVATEAPGSDIVVPEQRQYKQRLEVDLALQSDDFCLELWIRIFGRHVTTIKIESLHVIGKMKLALEFDGAISFPHMRSVSVSYSKESLQVSFNIQVLGSNLMNVPWLRPWIQQQLEGYLTTPFTVQMAPSGELAELEDYVTLTREPSILPASPETNAWNARMPCGHVVGRNSLSIYCRDILAQKKDSFYCPECNNEWPLHVVRHVAGLAMDDWQKMEKKVTRNYVEHNANIKSCPRCQTWCTRKNTRNPRVRCQACNPKADFCWSCGRHWLRGGIRRCGNAECA